MVLVELGLVEQRHVAVLEVLDGVAVTEVAERAGVSRQTVNAIETGSNAAAANASRVSRVSNRASAIISPRSSS